MTRLFGRNGFALCAMALAGLLGPGIRAENADSGLTLVEDGQARAVILVGGNAGAPTDAAARELNYWVRRITGTELRVVSAGEWDGHLPVIALGRSAFTDRFGDGVDPAAGADGSEGARVVVTPDYALLAGWPDPMHAVVEFVKHGLQVRWIWPGELGEVFDPRTTLRVAPWAWTWETRLPDMRRLRAGRYTEDDGFRGSVADALGDEAASHVSGETWTALTAAYRDWLRRQRVDVNRVRIGHAFGDWWDRYSEAHPDWFATLPRGRTQHGGRGVKLCVSHPQVAETVVRAWAERREEEGRDLRVMPNDSRSFCVCPRCRSWDAPEMQALSDEAVSNSDDSIVSDRYVRFWNRVAESAVAIDPSVRVTTYAYRSYQHPPLTDLRVHPNVLVGLVTGEGYYPDEPVRDFWGRWAAAGARLFWRPNLLHAGHGMPYVFARHLGEDIRFFHANNLAGIDFDSIAGHWATQGINYYVAAEMVTRPEADVETVLQEYYDAFGPASSAVAAYFDYWEEVTRSGPALMREHGLVLNETWGGWWPAFVRLSPLLFTEDVLDGGAEHLRRAERLAEEGRPVFRDRVAMLRAGFDHARLTARAVSYAVSVQGDDENARRAARASQATLLAFRAALLRTHPLAVDPAYLMRMEERRDLMWVDARPAVEAGEPLPGPWSFAFDPQETGVAEGWYREAWDDGAWEPIRVGTWWQQQPPGLRWHAGHGTHYEGVAWYRKTFEVAFREETDVYEGDRVLLHFGAVDAAAQVWVNGIEVMDRPYPYQGDTDSWKTPFAIDVTGQVRPGRPNRLAVRVDAVSGMGGIWRPVHVEVRTPGSP